MKNIFEEHLLRDEAVPHKCPKSHTDFLYSYVKVAIQPHKLTGVLSLSGSVGYDPLKKLLSARCASLEANIATLKVATDIILDTKFIIELNKKKVEYQGIQGVQMYGIYGMTISNTAGNPKFVKELYQDLSKNLQELEKIEKPVETGYWIAAFNYKDGQCLPPNKADKICPENAQNGGKKTKAKGRARKVSKPSKPRKSKKGGNLPTIGKQHLANEKLFI